MKRATPKFIAATMVLARLAIPLPLAAQESSPTFVHYSVTNLGGLGGSASNAYGGVNNRGWVTGEANLPGDQIQHGFLWRDGVMTDLGTLGGPNSSVAWPNKGNRGLVVGSAQIKERDPVGEFWGTSYLCTSVNCRGWQKLQRGFRWENGVISALPTLGGNNGFATGVNSRGQVVGAAETANQDPNCAAPQVFDYESVIWGPKPGEIQELPAFPGDSVAVAIAINDEGQVIGASGLCASPSSFVGSHAVLWQHDTVTNLGSLGGMHTFGLGLNRAGQVVGISALPGDATAHAFLWQSGLMTDLGTLPGDVYSQASDINNQSQVVGVSCDVNFNCRAFLWENGVMADLNALVSSDSLLYLTFGGGINDLGEIAGTAFDQNTGASPAFLAVPCNSEHADDEGCQAASQASISAERPRLVLPENIREQLRQKSSLGRFETGMMKTY